MGLWVNRGRVEGIGVLWGKYIVCEEDGGGLEVCQERVKPAGETKALSFAGGWAQP